MTVYAQLIVETIGTGFRLRVPHVGGAATLVWSIVLIRGIREPLPQREIGPLEWGPVRELIESGLLWKLTPQRSGQRLGWTELGLDGTDADLYALMQ